MTFRVLIVGAGITGSVTASMLRNKFQKSLHITVWEKEPFIGGRMRTVKYSSGITDIGAQYITTSLQNKVPYSSIYSELLAQNVIKPLSAHIDGLREFPVGTEHFVAPDGMSEIVDHFLELSVDEIFLEHKLTNMEENDGKWNVETENGKKETFDIVILTIPIPLMLELTGSIQNNIMNAFNNLKLVSYSSRYAIVLFYDMEHKINEIWDAKYVYDDSIIRYISIENRKRKTDSCISVVIHTTVNFHEENKDKCMAEIQNILVNHIKARFPNWPEATQFSCHKWTYSQVTVPFPNSPGFLIIQKQPLLIAGGDGFSFSTFDGCIESAINIVSQINL